LSAARNSTRGLSKPLAGTAGLACAAGIAALLGLSGSSARADPAATAATAWSALPAGSEAAPAAGNLGNSLETRGREVFAQRCAACHGPIPTEIFGPTFLPPMPGTQALAARYRGELPAALEERTDLVGVYIRTVVRSGYVSMPFFRPTELSDEDLDALVAYLTRERR
jgi:mono/diheme cytochrome c family protein